MQLKDKAAKGKKASGVPFIEEVQPEMVLRHKLDITGNGHISKDDHRLLETLNVKWWEAYNDVS